MIDLHKGIMERIYDESELVYNGSLPLIVIHEGDFYDLATDILKLVNDNYISKDLIYYSERV